MVAFDEVVVAAEQTEDGYGEEELERIDVKEDDEEEAGVDGDGAGVAGAEAAEVLVMRKPYQHQQREADGEGKEAAQAVVQLAEGVRDFERDDQQGERKTEDDVGKKNRSARPQARGGGSRPFSIWCWKGKLMEVS